MRLSFLERLMRNTIIIDISKTSEQELLSTPFDLLVIHFDNRFANENMKFLKIGQKNQKTLAIYLCASSSVQF